MDFNRRKQTGLLLRCLAFGGILFCILWGWQGYSLAYTAEGNSIIVAKTYEDAKREMEEERDRVFEQSRRKAEENKKEALRKFEEDKASGRQKIEEFKAQSRRDNSIFIIGYVLMMAGFVCFHLYRRGYCSWRIGKEVLNLGRNLTDEGAEAFARFVEDATIPNYPIMYNRLRAGWGMIRDSRNISPRMKERVKVALQSRGVVVYGGVGNAQRGEPRSNNQGKAGDEALRLRNSRRYDYG